MLEKINALKMMIEQSKRIVCFTGAGISCPPPTNIADFRSEKGIYSQKTKYNIPPEEIISHSFFKGNPKVFYEFYREKMVYRDALPNKAHYFFTNLEKQGKALTIVTQNIDGLHQKSGAKNVLELHGSVWRNYCMKCRRFYPLEEISLQEIPHCECGGIIKPDVVLYEESLNDDVVRESINAIAHCDLLIVVGTSLTVYPAASFLQYFNGENIVLINKQKTAYDSKATLVFNEDIIDVIDKLQQS